MKTAAFQTLGCKVNQTETASLQKLLADAGYSVVPFNRQADVYIINTCTVTHHGDSKSRQAIRRARRTNPDAVIVVTGCYAQVAPEEVLEIPDVDLVIGTHSRQKLPELIEKAKQGRLSCVLPLDRKVSFEELPPSQSGERTRAFLKVQEGCRQFCSYCIVPYARGSLYSRPPQQAAKEARSLAEAGFKEIVLTGVHLGSYGVDLPGKPSLSELINHISDVGGIARIRISSVEPTEVTSELVSTIVDNGKVCHHLHIPLQSGDDEILRRMNRRYTSGEYLYLIRWLRDSVPDIALTTDIMVGFPGETEPQFINTLRLAERCRFSRLHVFKFSPRRGTPAAGFPDQVPADVTEDRSRRLIELGEKLALEYRAGFIGRRVQVLFEEKERGKLAGLTEHYIRVLADAPAKARGELAEVFIKSEEKGSLLGELV